MTDPSYEARKIGIYKDCTSESCILSKAIVLNTQHIFCNILQRVEEPTRDLELLNWGNKHHTEYRIPTLTSKSRTFKQPVGHIFRNILEHVKELTVTLNSQIGKETSCSKFWLTPYEGPHFGFRNLWFITKWSNNCLLLFFFKHYLMLPWTF